MIRAHERGLDVRVITEAKWAGWGYEKLRSKGVRVKLDRNKALMHDKFAVIDRDLVWTGSYNLTESGARINHDNALLVRSRLLNENYAKEFAEMWEGQFGPGSPRNTRRLLRVGGVLVENYFSPEDHPAKRVVELIDGAKRTVDVAMYSFTSKGIARALVRARERGVVVRVVMDDRQARGKHSVDELLRARGIPVFLDGPKKTLHHKFMVVDTQLVLTGSYNFTTSAERRNDENLIVIHSPDLARVYLREMERLVR